MGSLKMCLILQAGESDKVGGGPREERQRWWTVVEKSPVTTYGLWSQCRITGVGKKRGCVVICRQSGENGTRGCEGNGGTEVIVASAWGPNLIEQPGFGLEDTVLVRPYRANHTIPFSTPQRYRGCTSFALC